MAPAEYVLEALERAQPLPEITDALDAEMLISDLAGRCAQKEAGDSGPSDDADVRAWEGLIAAAGARRSRRSAALLRGLAALLPPPQAERAASVLRDQPHAYRPPWAPALTALRAGTCWYGTSEEQTAYAFLLASYTYDGAEPHALAVSIDQANDGVIKDVFLTAGPGIEVTRDRLSGFSAAFEEVDAATAHHHLADAYAATVGSGPADDDLHSLRVLCSRRMREFGDG